MGNAIETTNKKVSPGRKLIDDLIGEFHKILPSHITPEKFGRMILTEFRRNPKLLECSKPSLIGSLMMCAETGLMPGAFGHSYLIPYFNGKLKSLECQFQIGYKGFVLLIRNSGVVSKIYANVVYENDHFVHMHGTEEKFEHSQALKNRGEFLAAYCYAVSPDGMFQSVIMTDEDIEKVRSKAKSDNIWKEWRDEMRKKSVIKRHSKQLPLDTETIRKIDLDEKTIHGSDVYGSKDLTDWSTPELADDFKPVKNGDVIDSTAEVVKEEIPEQDINSDVEQTEEKDFRVKLHNLLNEHCKGDKEMMADELFRLSAFTNKEKVDIPGKGKIDDLTDGRVKTTYIKYKKELGIK